MAQRACVALLRAALCDEPARKRAGRGRRLQASLVRLLRPQGVVGSFGKTTTCWLARGMFEETNERVGMIGAPPAPGFAPRSPPLALHAPAFRALCATTGAATAAARLCACSLPAAAYAWLTAAAPLRLLGVQAQ